MNRNLYAAGTSGAVKFAADFLTNSGRYVHSTPHRAHVILLDVPSFGPDGLLRDGSPIESLLEQASGNAVFIGGNLKHPAMTGRNTLDLLTDEFYLAQNAYITAEAALDVAMPYLDITVRNCPVLILGWGRIGKCLSRLMRNLEARVTVAVRKEQDLSILSALGYNTAEIGNLSDLGKYRLIFNTVPSPVLDEAACQEECVMIDLASRGGITGDNVITARGLPAIHFPESSGKLIAETILRKEELL